MENKGAFIILLVVTLVYGSLTYLYFNSKEPIKTSINLAIEQVELLKQQNGIMQLQYEICLKQAEMIQDIAVNLENKQNALRQDFEFFVSEIESWKVPIQNHSEMVQREYLKREAKVK